MRGPLSYIEMRGGTETTTGRDGSAAVAMTLNCVTVFGGTGFLGRAIVERLAAGGTTVRVSTRHPDAVKVSNAEAKGGRILPFYADVRDETSVGLAVEGCDAAVNVVGLYLERGAETFRAVHELGAMHVARQSARAGVKALVHVSGIGADLKSPSRYVRSRAQGEVMARESFKDTTIVRPSVLFGPGDKFLNSLVAVTRRSPVMALFGGGTTRLQPVYVDDVAEAVLRLLNTPSSQGRVYELGGPQIYEYRALIELVLKEAGRSRLLMPLPFFAWDVLARLLMLLPNPPLTTDVVELMRRDNVVADGAPTFADLDLEPTAMEILLPVMLGARP